MESSTAWIEAVTQRLSCTLPHKVDRGPWSAGNSKVQYKNTGDCIVGLSQQEFATVINGISSIILELIQTAPPTNANNEEKESYILVLEILASCLAKKEGTPVDDDDVHSLLSLYQKITQLCLLPGENAGCIREKAQRVLFFLSGLHFHGIFNKIILRVTSVNRVLSSQGGDVAGSERCVIQLILHLNLNAARLQQILQVMVTSFKDLKKQKNIFVTIPPVLHRSIWNFISEYPSQFNDLLNKEYPSLPRSAEKLFMMCDEYADNQRRKSQVWPLQNTLLILCPNILRDIAESGIDNSSGPHKAQRAFLSAVMKALASISKQMCEAATVCGVDMFKACAYVGDSSAPVFRYYLNLIQGNLQNLLFNPQQGLFLHQSSSALALIPTFTDLGMMVTCLVAQFRCNYRNSHIFSVCLNPSSPPIFRLAFIRSIHTLLEQNTLPSWPGPEAVHTYAPQLREIFQNVLPQLRRYDTSQPNLALDVKAYLTTSATATSMLTNKSKADRKSLVEMITHYQLMAGLIRLFEIDPMLAFAAPPQGKRGVTESLQLMTGLVSILQHQSLPNMPLHVSDVLLTLHRPDNIELWDPHDSLSAFGEISNQVTYSIALKLFGRKTSNPIQLLGLLKQILQYRTHFLKKRSSEAIQSSSSKIAPQMYTMLETVLLLFIRNTNVEAVTIAMSCFKYLVLEAELVMNPMEPSVVTYCPNLLAYQQLDQASSEPQIGRASQQKKVRSILRELVHTPGSALAWEDTYSSWRVTKSILLVYQKEEATNPPDLLRFSTESFPRQIMRRVNTLAQSSALGTGGSREQVSGREGEDITSSLQSWTNMTGFLCSLAGVSTKPSSGYSFLLMSTSNSSINSIDGEVTPPTVHRNIGTSVAPTIKDPNHRVRRSSSYHGGRPKSVVNVSPARTSALESSCVVYPSARLSGEGMLEDPSGTRTSQTETFIAELIFLLSCHNEAIGVNIRETVKELVSFELSPPVYPYLFRCMVVETSGIFSDGRLVIQERHTALIDQLVSIVHHILESRTEDALEHLAHVKMDDLIMNFIIYVNSLDSTTRSLTISVKLCHLIETLMQHSRDLSFRQEVQFRNQVAEHLTGWVKGQVCLSASSTSHMENVQNDLDLGAMKALGQVLNGLVLQPRGMTGDVFEQKSKLFQRHFTKFMDLIHSLNHVDWSVLSPIHTHSLQRHVTQLKEATICAMAHMLTANIDSGLTHAIGLGYHEDLRTRTSFIEVLTSILKEGAQFSSLAETALADRLNQMLDLVTTETADGDLPVVMALIDSVPPENVDPSFSWGTHVVCQYFTSACLVDGGGLVKAAQDELAEDLVTLFDSKHKLAPFLNSILNTEMDDAESGRVDTLFRGNTIACKVLSSSFKTFGLYYLQSVVRPLILQLLKIGDKDFEVDPARMSDTSRLAENQANLLDLVQTFCNTIISSLSSVSLQLRTVCHTLYSVVAEHYPDGSLDTVSSALFLRFINPAIVSPQSYNLVQGDIPNGTRRGLTFISKVLQNLANHIEFKKEAHMQVFNQFLRDNFERTRNHALHLSAMGPFKDGEAVEYISFLKESLKHRLHSLLWTHQDKMAAYAASTRTSVSARQPFHQLNTLLAQLGAPNYRRKRTSYTIKRRSTMVSSQLEAFLETMAGECDEKALRAIKASDIFYSGGVSKLGNPVFYFIARKFRGDQISFSHQMLYHIMTLLKSCTDKSFEIVIDLTQATQINEPDLELLVKFAAYIPELVMSRIEAVYVYNTNLAFRNYAHKLSSAIRIFSHIKGAKRVMLVDTLSQFSSHIDISELKLPSGTMVFEEEEGKVEFNQAHFLVTKAKTLMVLQVPARLQVCPHGLVVHMTEKMKVFESLVLIKEIYHISDIREVYSEDKESLTVRLVEGSHPLKFTVNKADEIVKAIGTVISRWQNQQPSRYMSERKLEPKDVPGTFLNLALLNLGSTDADLRVAAYKLLSGVKHAFHLRISYQLESSHDLCVPMNTAPFVMTVSRELAQKEPHLTLEFLSEVVAGFQQYTPALKQFCLAYMSPWLPNLSLSLFEATATDHEKLMRLVDMLVALSISEDSIYPLIQSFVWDKIGGEPRLLKRVLDSFIRMSISDGLGSRKLEVLADTAVTLEQSTDGAVTTEVIKKILKTIAHTSDKVTQSLEQHFLWSELTVLSRFLLALSCNNPRNAVKNLTDVFYLCIIMMGNGPTFVKATIHGIVLNTVQSLASVPQIMANEEATKSVSLKLAEISEPKFYHQFGIQKRASSLAYQRSVQPGRGPALELGHHGSPSSTCVTSITQHLLDLVNATAHLIPECTWMQRWQKLARRTSFHYNPALQTRSFLMLGVISNKASLSLVTRTLRVLEETLGRREDEVYLLESITICLTAFLPLLEEGSKLMYHFFWVAVGIMQLGEATLYAASLELMEACIKKLTLMKVFEKQTLASAMQPSREELEWPLSQMDREVGISFSSDFNFSLAALLYKGFSHPLSTVRTRTQELLTTLFFIHSPDVSGGRIEVYQDNLAYITVLFPESEIVRKHLREPRPRLKTLASSLEDSPTHSSYNTLLSSHAVPSQKQQILFLFVLACALINTQDEKKTQILYEFLANASKVYFNVFPLIRSVLMQNLVLTLQQSQSPHVLSAVQQLVSVAVERVPSDTDCKLTVINDLGFGGVREFFNPFPKHGLVYPTSQGTLLQKYLETLVAHLSPTEECVSKSHSLSSMKDFATSGNTNYPLSGSSALRRSSQAIPPSHNHQRTGSGPSPKRTPQETNILDPDDTDF